MSNRKAIPHAFAGAGSGETSAAADTPASPPALRNPAPLGAQGIPPCMPVRREGNPDEPVASRSRAPGFNRPTKPPLTPDVLPIYQQQWVADPRPVKACEKSRRVRLSWAEASDTALTAAKTRAAGGMNVWYIGYNKEMAQEFIRDTGNWVRHFELAAEDIGEELLKDEDKDILTYVIRFASGFRVTALSSRPSNLRGKQGVVIIDEAAFHEDLAGLMKAALALLERFVISLTHSLNF